MVGWTYDAAGNLLSDGTTSYSYDALNRASSTGGTANSYNADGVLVQQGTTRYTQDLASPLSQILGDGTSWDVYGAERLFAQGGGGAKLRRALQSQWTRCGPALRSSTMNLIAQLTLHPSPTEAAALSATVTAANAACTYISQIAWQTRTFRYTPLQQQTYRAVREQFGLGAHLTVRCRVTVLAAYRRDSTQPHVCLSRAPVAADARRWPIDGDAARVRAPLVLYRGVRIHHSSQRTSMVLCDISGTGRYHAQRLNSHRTSGSAMIQNSYNCVHIPISVAASSPLACRNGTGRGAGRNIYIHPNLVCLRAHACCRCHWQP